MRKIAILVLLLLVAIPAHVNANPAIGANPVFASVTTIKPLKQADVRAGILSACSRRGWYPKEIKPGLIEASIQVRSHTVVVDIPYTAKEFQIKYKNSVNLITRSGKIHRNYNKWVATLRKDIDLELNRIAITK